MKKSQIVLIVFVVVAVGVIISLVTNTDPYSDFSNAKSKAGKKVQIVGVLNKDMPIVYDAKNVNEFTFYMIDRNGDESKVVHLGAKPQDFEKQSQVISVGYWKDEVFVSESLQLKCPSKYNEKNNPEAFQVKKI